MQRRDHEEYESGRFEIGFLGHFDNRLYPRPASCQSNMLPASEQTRPDLRGE
jgi:hypothetical protein